MKKYFKLMQTFNFPKETIVEFHKTLEVSLDCHICKKLHRTIIVEKSEKKSFCPSGDHQFPAVLKNVEVIQEHSKSNPITTVNYALEYDFFEFVAVRGKYDKNESDPTLTWIRIYFNIKCPRCRHKDDYSTQTNMVRPYQQLCNNCNLPLYDDKEEPLIEMLIKKK